MLLDPLTLRDLTLPNRIVLGPMQMYMAEDGLVNDWHVRHLNTFARGGFGTVFTEALAVDPRGRSSYGDLGAWSDSQVPGLTRLAEAIRKEGAIPAAQLWHAGMKASRRRSWGGIADLDAEDAAKGEAAWIPVGPVAAVTPRQIDALTLGEIAAVKAHYVDATRRCVAAGFEIVELHAGHGYLLHSFYSPVTNRRGDAYGGDRDGRMRLLLEVAADVRAVMAPRSSLFVRLSCVDEASDGWTMDDTLILARHLKVCGVDLIDCSSGGSGTTMSAGTRARRRPAGFQVPLAAQVREQAGLPTMAVGLIRTPHHADGILRCGNADLICIAREALFDPFWGLHAALALKGEAAHDLWPHQYGSWLRRRAATFDQAAPPVGLGPVG